MSIKRVFLLVSLLAVGQIASSQSLKVESLKTEHLESPLGVDKANPRLSWRMVSADEGAAQGAFRLLVGRDSLKVSEGSGDVWDSGKQGIFSEV